MAIPWSQIKSRTISQVLFFAVFLGSVIYTVTLQCLLFLIVKPFSLRVYRQLGYYLSEALNSQWVFLLQWWANIDIEMCFESDPYYEKHHGHTNAIIMANHRFEIDLPLTYASADFVGNLGGIKLLLKRELRKLPIVGWYWQLQENLFLNRNWQQDKDVMGKQLENILASSPHPVWIGMMPEGTRFTEEKHQKSLEFAREKNLPEFKHLLLPRTKGFQILTQHRNGEKGIKTVYDVTILSDPSKDKAPTARSTIRAGTGAVKVLLKRIPIAEVPEDSEACAQWLYKLFQEKDKILDEYFSTGNVAGFEHRVKMTEKVSTLLNWICWATLVYSPLLYGMAKALCAGWYMTMCIPFVIIGAVAYALEYTTDAGTIKKSS